MHKGRQVAGLLALALAALAGAADAQSPAGSGTGFFVNSAGWVLTNDHVVEGCSRIEVPGHGAPRSVLRDPANDLAALLVGPPPAPPLAFRARPARMAEAVHALGYPLSGVLSASVKVTSGTVNALAGIGNDTRFLQISAPVQPGNSGGPVIDDAGLVVGIATARLDPETFVGAQNVNFALRAEIAAAFLAANGIAFESRDAAGPGASLPDVVEAAAAATVPVHCGGAAPVPADPPRSAAPPAASGFRIEPGFDVYGFDYLLLEDVTLAGCQASCAGEPRCLAFTFNRRHGRCFLKDGAAFLFRHDDAVGGYRDWMADGLERSRFSLMANTDSYGGDYDRVRPSDFRRCHDACTRNPRCRGFAYVPERQDCWLKDRIGTITREQGVLLGLR